MNALGIAGTSGPTPLKNCRGPEGGVNLSPPSRSALDFLDAPKRLGSFLDGKFIRLLMAPAKVGGRAGMKFLNVGIEVALSTPIGLSGVALRPLPRHDIRPARFEAHGGQVIVWVEVESDQSFVFGSSDVAETARRLEGEIVLF